MVSKAVRRSGGQAVGVTGAVAVIALGLGLLSARPADRPTADIHSEYVKYSSGKDTLTAYLAYPERRDPAPAVIVIHDIYGMGDRLRPAVELRAFLQTREKPDVADTAWAAIERFFRAELGR